MLNEINPLFSQSTLYRGIVTANKDPEKLGRIQVKFPGLHGKSSSLSSQWARVVQPYGSSGNGAWFLPEVGDEVVVAFENHEADLPLVLGTLYSEKNRPPASGQPGDFNEDGKNSLKFIRSRAGNLIALDDDSSSPSTLLVGKKSLVARDDCGAQMKLENGKIAIGNAAGELLDIFEQLLDSIQSNAPTFVSTAVGPGILNPSLIAKVTMLKAKLAAMKGSL